MKMELRSQLENSKESHTCRIYQAEDRILDLKDKVEGLDHIPKEHTHTYKTLKIVTLGHHEKNQALKV